MLCLIAGWTLRRWFHQSPVRPVPVINDYIDYLELLRLFGRHETVSVHVLLDDTDGPSRARGVYSAVH